jgi:hypothetical protein
MIGRLPMKRPGLRQEPASAPFGLWTDPPVKAGPAEVESQSGGRMADMVRVDLLAIAKWHAERVDDYTVPFKTESLA